MDRTENITYTANANVTEKPEYSMKWHNFLIWFSLFFSAIVNIVDGIGCMRYAGIVDSAVFFGISEIMLGAFLIFVRFRLSGFKKNAVNCFTAAQAANIVLSVLCMIVLDMGFDVSSIAGSIAMIVITRNYYGKRSELFVN